MFRQDLFWFLAFILILLIIMWVIGGGPRRAYQQVPSFEILPFSPAAAGFRLPWQPAELFPTIDITKAFQPAEEDSLAEAQYQLVELEAEYERLNREAAGMRT